MAGSKILFLDLDQTLLRDDKSVSEKNREAIHTALKKGNYIVLATGRPVDSGRRVVKELGLSQPGCYMIAYNGGLIYDCAADKVLVEHTMSIEDVEYLFQKAEEDGLYIQTYTQNYIITQKRTRETQYYIDHTGMECKVGEVASLIDDEPHKVLLIELEDHEKLVRFKEKNAQWAEQHSECFFSSPQYLEYCPKGVNKGSGVEYIRKLLNVKKENTIGVGDEENDIPLLQQAAIGIAVKNASDTVKEAADFVTEHDNNEDAIAEVIEKYVLPR